MTKINPNWVVLGLMVAALAGLATVFIINAQPTTNQFTVPTAPTTEPSRVGPATAPFKEAVITLTIWRDGMDVDVDVETTVGHKTTGRHWERTVAVSQLVPLDGKGVIDDITINKEIMTDLDKAGADKATVYVRVMRGFSVDKNDSKRVVGCIDSSEELTKRGVRAYVYDK